MKKSHSNVVTEKTSIGKTITYQYKLNQDEAKYLKAIMDPRSPDAEGVQIPDRFPFPTVPYKGAGRILMGSSGGGTITFYWFPTPTMTFIFTNGSVPQATSMFGFGGSLAYAHTSDNLLAADLDTVRPVACGFSISNDQGFSNIVGAGIATPFICADVGMDQTDFTNAASPIGAASILSNGAVANLTAPGSVEFKMDQLIDNDLLFTTRPVDPSGYSFRECSGTSDVIGNNYAILTGTETFGAVSGTVGTQNIYNGGNPRGMVGYVVQITGLPASTNCLYVDFWSHFEGSMTVTSSNNYLLPSCWKRSQRPVGNIETALSFLPSQMIRLVQPAVQGFVKNIGRGFLGNIAKLSK